MSDLKARCDELLQAPELYELAGPLVRDLLALIRELLAECERLTEESNQSMLETAGLDAIDTAAMKLNAAEISRLRGENVRLDGERAAMDKAIDVLEADLDRHKKLVERLREHWLKRPKLIMYADWEFYMDQVLREFDADALEKEKKP